jgi:hypothetical protein
MSFGISTNLQKIPLIFHSPTHDLARFLQTAQEEGLYVLLRPGPFVGGEWDFGGSLLVFKI